MRVRNVSSTREARDHIIECLREELVGPSPGHPLVQFHGKDHPLNGQEILRPQDPPRYRYAAGILFPAGVRLSAALDASEEASDIEAADEEPAPEENAGEAADALGTQDQPDVESGAVEDKVPDLDVEVDPTSSFLPSTLGISFLAEIGQGVHVGATWGRYDKRPVPGFPSYRNDGKIVELWFRTPGEAAIEVGAAELVGSGKSMRPARRLLSSPEDPAELQLDIVSRPWDKNQRLITITLVNAGRKSHPVNENCFFQCGLRVAPLEGTRILRYPGRPTSTLDPEELSLALLYRHRPTYAVGHGCSADWDVLDGVVESVRSETLPFFEQPPVLPLEQAEGVELSMRRLAEAETNGLAASCRALASAYKSWIGERELDLSTDPELVADPILAARASDHLHRCRACLSRIIDGVELLETNPDAADAFRMMNMAMVEQRAHYALASEDENRRTWVKGPSGQEPSTPYAAPEYPYSTRWRPFQLAFVLMNIRSFVDPAHSERSLVDVIWFPTGGGKTEAYLGLAAFAILLRRLRDPADAGTTVLMRYTLRLLTTQQFQRAASLICALERRRRGDPARLGTVPISIGLWLGGSVTPNRDDGAVRSLSEISRDGADNPFVVLRCPWCGVDMGPHDYDSGARLFGYRKERRADGGYHVHFACEDRACAFSSPEGLPLEVVDEGIYREAPTLLIGTVDKFAMMPWNPDSRVIFGIDNPHAKSPPDLVIQDELHLISGPLGSMVGHYETLIDEFATSRRGEQRIPAKIVASTATIARAEDQIQAVYGRSSALFPPQGLFAGESFFAREGTGSAGRTYVGVLATAVPSHVTAQVRTLSVLLQAPALLDAAPGHLDGFVDPYWTLVVYFNSLRELGRASTLVQADIREYLNSVWDRIGVPLMNSATGAPDRRRFINNFDELTSRMRSSEIPATLQRLFTARPSRDAVDLCYATNMIQVGLDVPRLSLMTVVGQPKGASEYIQASSRVGRGRDRPGLVITNYNPFKPRDRSHFESFRSFHENAYRHVEPTSVTPFSIPVCERAIHALAVAYARFRFAHLRDSPRVGLTQTERAEIEDLILGRVASVADDEVERAKLILDRFLDDWDRRRPQEYGSLSREPSDPLMQPAGRPLPASLSHLATTVRQTATSMRNVDADCEAVPIAVYAVDEEA